VVHELCENLSYDEPQAMIDEFDKDSDCEINENEFLSISITKQMPKILF